MTLHIGSLKLRGFRSYDELEINDLPGLMVFLGPNAIGKTNIIEAIQLLTAAESFKNPEWKDICLWGAEKTQITAEFKDEKRLLECVMKVEEGRRTYLLNGKKKSATSMRGILPSILFIPDDLRLVKAASSMRRASVDDLGCQLSKNYTELNAEYRQSLKQRNQLIKEGMDNGPLFESWNESLFINGSRLFTNRVKLFNRVKDAARRIYPSIAPGEEFEALYTPSWMRFNDEGKQLEDRAVFKEEEFSQKVEEVENLLRRGAEKVHEAEVRRKTSLIGPHKDDISFFLNGYNARRFASQGQQRSIVLAWKLAQVEVIKEVMGIDPVLLLDDVMSELDEQRRDALTGFVRSGVQTFITTTNLGYFSEELLKGARIIELPIG